jgi:hypothetical protein
LEVVAIRILVLINVILKVVVEVTNPIAVEVGTILAVAMTIAARNRLLDTSIPGSRILHTPPCLMAALITLSTILRQVLILLSSHIGELMRVMEHRTMPRPITHLLLFLRPTIILITRLKPILPSSTLHSRLMGRRNNIQRHIRPSSHLTQCSGPASLIRSRLRIQTEGREAAITIPLRLSRMQERVLPAMAMGMTQCTQLLVAATASHMRTTLA